MIESRPTTKTGTLIFLLTALLLVPELGQCFYNPTTGRWLSRDPTLERGGPNFYCFVFNHGTGNFDTDGREASNGQSGNSIPAEPTNAQCSKFSWWNKAVGVTFTDCKPQLTGWGKQMPQFLQDCVLRHENVHAKQCKDCGAGLKGVIWYSLLCSCPIKHCAEQAAYAQSVSCGKEAMKTIDQLSANDQLALRCYLASSKSSCRAEKKECDKRWKRTPGAQNCD